MTKHLFGAARQQLLVDVRNLYAIGLTIREIAAEVGYSYAATRAQLLAAGVVLRPKHGGRPTQARSGNPLTVACPSCGRGVGRPCAQVGIGRGRSPHAKRFGAVAR